MNTVSVVVPTCEPNRYLWKCLDSLREQTFQSVEVWIILNGPQEPFYAEIQCYLVKYSLNHFHLLYSLKKGVSSARNLALDNIESGFVMFLDDDDFITPDYLSNLVKNLHETSISTSKVISFISETGDFFENYTPKNFIALQKSILPALQCPSIFSSACAKLIPRELIGDKRFSENLTIGEDAFFMFQLFEKSLQVSFTDKAIYYRRIRSDSVSHRHYSLFFILQNRLKLIHCYTVFYLNHRKKFSFLFFVRRLFAIMKSMFHLLKYR